MTPREFIQITLYQNKTDRSPMQFTSRPQFADHLWVDLQIQDRPMDHLRAGGKPYERERAIAKDG